MGGSPCPAWSSVHGTGHSSVTSALTALRFVLCLGLLHAAWSLSLAGPDPSENPPGHFPTLTVPHAIPQPPQTQPTATSCLELWAVGTPSSLPQMAALIGSCLTAISPAHTPDRAALGGACPLLPGGLSWRRVGQDLARGFCCLGSEPPWIQDKLGSLPLGVMRGGTELGAVLLKTAQKGFLSSGQLGAGP